MIKLWLLFIPVPNKNWKPHTFVKMSLSSQMYLYDYYTIENVYYFKHKLLFLTKYLYILI